MSYLNKMLLPDERITYIATLHWVIFIPGIILTVLGGVLGMFSYDIAAAFLQQSMIPYIGRVVAGIGFVCAVAGLALLTGAMIRQSATELAITNRRLIAKYGFISRSTFEIMINRVTGANFDQTVTGRVLGFGTVLVHGTGGDISPFDVIADPQSFQRALLDGLERARNGG